MLSMFMKPDGATLRVRERQPVEPPWLQVPYPVLRHETLFEPEGPGVAADVVGWLREAVEAF